MIKLSVFMRNHNLRYNKSLDFKLTSLGIPYDQKGPVTYISKETSDMLHNLILTYKSLDEYVNDASDDYSTLKGKVDVLRNKCIEKGIHVYQINELPFLHKNAVYFISVEDSENVESLVKTLDFTPTNLCDLRLQHLQEGRKTRAMQSLATIKDNNTNPNRNHNKIAQLTALLEPLFNIPDTHTCLCEYVQKHYGKVSCDSITYFVSVLSKEKELYDYSPTETTELLNGITEQTSKIAEYLFSFMKYFFSIYPNSNITLKDRRNKSITKNPTISLEKYKAMAYFLFNEEHIRKNHMFQKAMLSRQLASQYLYMAMHFTCGWRSYDIITMPIPRLHGTVENTKRMVMNHNFPNDLSELYVNDLELYLVNVKRKPTKTQKFDAPSLTFHAFESYRHVLGVLIAICTVHYIESGATSNIFLDIDNMSALSISELLGEEYIKICGRRNFHSRAYNRRYLQLISDVAECVEDSIDPYVLASYARSHIGGYRSFATSTATYLKAKMDEMDVNEILIQLYERGICSFLPYLILDKLDHDNFNKLNVEQQTALINSIPHDCYSLEKICELSSSLFQNIKDQVSYLTKLMSTDPDSVHTNIEIVLNRLVSGQCAGKENFVHCLRLATGYACDKPEGQTCLGCIANLFTKTYVFYIASRMLHFQQAELSAKTEASKFKYRSYNLHYLLPILEDMLLSMQTIYHIDTTRYHQMVTNILAGKGDAYLEIFS